MAQEDGEHTAQAITSKRWRGLLSDEQTAVRHAVTVLLFGLAATMPFGSLGFYPAFNTHVFLCLIPVALAALLFGTWRGCAVGAVAGLAEMVHSIFQPYNYYEEYLLLPVNSVVLFALYGLLLGILFGLACRLPRRGDRKKDRTLSHGGARMGAVTAAVLAASACFTLYLHFGFVFANDAFAQYIPASISQRASSTEGALLQIVLHTFMCALPCVITTMAVDRFGHGVHKLRVRSAFQIWLGALTIGFFFLASAAAYTSLTHLSIVNMNVALTDQLASLSADLRQRDTIVNTLNERGVFPPEELEGFARRQYSQINCDLAGWLQDATVLAEDGVVFASNKDELIGMQLKDLVSAETGEMVFSKAIESDEAVECYLGSGYEISYLYAMEQDFTRAGKTGKYQLAVVVPAKEAFLNRPLYMYIVAAVFAALLGTIIVVLMGLLRRVVVRPVDATNQALERITAGELDQRAPDSAYAEFSSLSDGINTTVGALEDSIAEANARIDSELAAARTIQESALPTAQPPFPDIDAFDLHATMDPARQVGGDFYDYFPLGLRGIGFVVADVSGKGMPAALFMMAAKTAIRGAMESKGDLAEAIGIANRSLCEGNESEMFVTAFAGVFDYQTGKLTFVNAGHNKPLIQHDGTWAWVKERSGPYLGSFDWVDYKQFEMDLVPGDELFVYTDGVNEAFNVNEECYGNDRLIAYLDYIRELHPRQMLRAMRAELTGWADGAEQSDDITMLALKYGIPPEYGASLTTTADVKNFEQVESFIREQLNDSECPRRVANQLMVAVEELVVNVCSYAYPEATPENPGELRVHFTRQTSPNAIMIEVGDDGIPFDPLAHKDPERPANIQEAKIGGLGIMMTKKFMDEVQYVREGITNVTIIKKYWD